MVCARERKTNRESESEREIEKMREIYRESLKSRCWERERSRSRS